MSEETFQEYQKAKRAGEQAVRKAASEGRYPYLPALISFLPDFTVMPKIPVGVMEIPLSMIAGTVTEGRQNAFACNYMPILREKSEFAVKWEKLYAAQKNEGIHDAVKCYEYMKRFYILEGNKRVSVLDYVGAYSIAADIQRIMPKKTDDPEVQAYYEFLKFFDVTKMYEITCRGKEGYEKLAACYGMDLQSPWPEEKIEELRSDYRIFSAAYTDLGGDRLPMAVGDAFLAYLKMYPDKKLIDESGQQIERRIRRIWNELITSTKEDDIALIEQPEVGAKKRMTIASLFGTGRPDYSKEHPLRAAFIYSKDPGTSRWNYGHELGRNELNANFDGIVDAISFTKCDTEEKIDAAFEAAAADLEDVVFTTSPDMMEASIRAAIKYPDLKILNCSINLTSSAVRTYYPKMFEAKFLMGALAAAYADDHRIGYVADYPLYGNIANINAFAIGAGVIDPYAKIYLSWTGTKNTDWEKELEQDRGLRIISGPDSIRPDQNDRKYGLYKRYEDGHTKKIAAPIWHWGKFYSAIIRSILDGSWDEREKVSRTQPINYWFGMQSGAVDVIFSDELSYYSRKLIKMLRAGIINDTIMPFRGEMHSTAGQITGEGHPAMSNRDIIEMNWLNDNVEGHIPAADELIDSVQKTLLTSGLKEN